MFAKADDIDLDHLKLFEMRVISAYAQYNQQQGNSEHLAPVPGVSAELIKAINSCYKRLGNKGITPSYIRDLLLDAVPVCPYCGVGETAELDHVLPRSIWPEFTIHISNLVPACGKCNGRKSDRSFRSSGWSYRHPYFHPELTSKFLFATADIRGTNIKYEFTVRRPMGTSDSVYLSVEESFTTFQLAKRFASQSVYKLSNRSHKLKQLFNALGGNGVKDYLLGESASIANVRGINYWEAVLLNDLAEIPEYCNFGTWT
jgi:hypothetical protein